MKRLSPWWLGWLGLIIAGIVLTKDSYIHVVFFIVPMLIILFMGITIEQH